MAKKDVFDLPLGDIKLTDIAGELSPAMKLLRDTAPPLPMGSAGRRATLSISSQRAVQKAAEAQAAAMAMANIPAWETVKAGLQGYDALPYSEQRKLYDEYTAKYIETVKAADPKADEFAIFETLSKTNPGPVEPTRTWGEAVSDVASGAAQGLEGFYGSIANAINPASDAAVASRFRSQQRNAGRSAVELDRQKQIAFELEQLAADPDKSMLGQFFAEAGIQVRNLSAAGVTELATGLAPSLLIGGGIGAGVRTLALRLGVQAAVAGTRGATAATAAGTVLEGVSTGGEAAGQTYQTIMDADLAELQADPEWAQLLAENGGDEQAAREALATGLARVAQAWGTTAGVVLSAAPGSLERRVGVAAAGAPRAPRGLGRRAAGIAGTAGLEGLTEAAAPISSNIALGEENLLAGAGGDFALGALAGTGGTAVTATAGRALGRRQTQEQATARAELEAEVNRRVVQNPDGSVTVGATTLTGEDALQTAQAAARAEVTRERALAQVLGESDGQADEPAPITEAVELNLGGAAVVVQPGGRAEYAPDQTPNELADSYIAAQNAALGELPTGVDENAPPAPDAIPGPAVPSVAAIVERDTEGVTDTAVTAAERQTAQQFNDEAGEVATRANALLQPAVARILNGDMFAGLQIMQATINALSPADRAALSQADVPGVPSLTDSPAGFAMRILGMGLEVGDFDGRMAPMWADRLQMGDGAEVQLRTVSEDGTAGTVNRAAASFVLELYRASGIPFPATRFQAVGARQERGSYAPATHTLSFTNRTTPNTVSHENLHALTVRGLDRVASAASQGNARARRLLALMRYLQTRLQQQAGDARVYGLSNEAEMLAELVRPEFLALAARTPIGTLPAELQQAVGELPTNGTLLDLIARMVARILSFLPNVNVVENNVLDILVRAAAEFTEQTGIDQAARTPPVSSRQDSPARPPLPSSAPAMNSAQAEAYRQAAARVRDGRLDLDVFESGITGNGIPPLVVQAFLNYAENRYNLAQLEQALQAFRINLPSSAIEPAQNMPGLGDPANNVTPNETVQQLAPVSELPLRPSEQERLPIGTALEVLPNGTYRVELPDGSSVAAASRNDAIAQATDMARENAIEELGLETIPNGAESIVIWGIARRNADRLAQSDLPQEERDDVWEPIANQLRRSGTADVNARSAFWGVIRGAPLTALETEALASTDALYRYNTPASAAPTPAPLNTGVEATITELQSIFQRLRNPAVNYNPERIAEEIQTLELLSPEARERLLEEAWSTAPFNQDIANLVQDEIARLRGGQQPAAPPSARASLTPQQRVADTLESMLQDFNTITAGATRIGATEATQYVARLGQIPSGVMTWEETNVLLQRIERGYTNEIRDGLVRTIARLRNGQAAPQPPLGQRFDDMADTLETLRIDFRGANEQSDDTASLDYLVSNLNYALDTVPELTADERQNLREYALDQIALDTSQLRAIRRDLLARAAPAQNLITPEEATQLPPGAVVRQNTEQAGNWIVELPDGAGIFRSDDRAFAVRMAVERSGPVAGTTPAPTFGPLQPFPVGTRPPAPRLNPALTPERSPNGDYVPSTLQSARATYQPGVVLRPAEGGDSYVILSFTETAGGAWSATVQMLDAQGNATERTNSGSGGPGRAVIEQVHGPARPVPASTVQQPTAASAGIPASTLAQARPPRNLAGALRGFNWNRGSTPRRAVFTSPVDAALYIARPDGSSARRQDYINWLLSLGMTETQMRLLSRQVAAAARDAAARGDSGSFTVPPVASVSGLTLGGATPAAAPPVAAAAPGFTGNDVAAFRTLVAAYVVTGNRRANDALRQQLYDSVLYTQHMNQGERAAADAYIDGTNTSHNDYLNALNPIYSRFPNATPGSTNASVNNTPPAPRRPSAQGTGLTQETLTRARDALRRLGSLFAARGQQRGVPPGGALGTLITENATQAEKIEHFWRAMEYGINWLNNNSPGQTWRLSISDRARGTFSVKVTERGSSREYGVAGGTAGSSIGTTGFADLVSYGERGGAGGRFYDVFNGASLSARLPLYNGSLTDANQARMPGNRLRSIFKWGRILGDYALATRLAGRALNSSDSIYVMGPANDLSAMNMLVGETRRALNANQPLTYDHRSNTISVNGEQLTPQQLTDRLYANPTYSGAERRVSPDIAAMAALIDTLAQGDANPDEVIAAWASTPGNRTLFSEPEASLLDLALDGESEGEIRYSEPAPAIPGVTPADLALTAATEEGADNIVGDTPVPRERLTAPALIQSLQSNTPAAPSTVTRGVLQALARGDWAGAREQLARTGEFLNVHLHDHLVPMKRWIQSLPVPAQLIDRVLAALYTAPNRRDEQLQRALDNGGRELRRVLAEIASASGMTTETATQQAGYWLTAMRAPTGNQNLLEADARAVAAAQRAFDAEPSRANARALRDATTRLQERTRAVLNPNVNVRRHIGDGVAGFSNAQARAIRDAVESRISPALLQRLAQHAYDLNAWRLSLDIETGKTSPAVASAFLGDATLEPVLQQLRAAALSADAAVPGSLATLEALREQVADLTRSNYVPLTGDPTAALDEELFNSGSPRQPNVGRDYRMTGRTTSIPDDAITATWASVLKSASYAGWSPFQDVIAEAYLAMSPEERTAVGLFRTTIGQGNTGPTERAIIRRRGNQAQAFFFRDRNLLESIRGANIDSNAVMMNGFAKLTRAYSFAATQLNLFFAPKNFIRDAWERSELLRTREYRDADGNVVDSTLVARRMLSYLMDPTILTVTGREAFGIIDTSKRGLMLREFIERGGASLFSDRFAPTRVNLVEGILNERTGSRQLRAAWQYTFGAWNKTFEMAPALAAHMALRDFNVPPDTAAAGSLDLMNFRKRGQSMALPNALYAFAQPAVTGGANALSALYNPATGKINSRGWTRLATYTLAFAAAQAFFRSLADEDEGGNRLDQQSELVQNSHLLIPMGDGLVKVPLAFGLTRVANGAARAMIGAGTGELTPSEAAGRFFKGSFIPVFSPIEANEIDWQQRPVQAWLTTFMPTWMKPVLSVGLNVTPWGTPVVRDSYEKTDQYRSEQFGKGVAPEYKAIARSLREASGVDLAPEEIKMLITGYPMGPLSLIWKGLVENDFAKTKGRPTTNPLVAQVYAGYSSSARYFQFQDALLETNGLLKEFNVGVTDFSDTDRRMLAWRRGWDEQEKGFRREIGAVTRAKGLTEEAKQRQKDAIQRRREQAQMLALYNYRVVSGQPAKRVDVPAELLPAQ